MSDKVLRTCIDCGDQRMVVFHRRGKAPERCFGCSRKLWAMRFSDRARPARKPKKKAA